MAISDRAILARTLSDRISRERYFLGSQEWFCAPASRADAARSCATHCTGGTPPTSGAAPNGEAQWQTMQSFVVSRAHSLSAPTHGTFDSGHSGAVGSRDAFPLEPDDDEEGDFAWERSTPAQPTTSVATAMRTRARSRGFMTRSACRPSSSWARRLDDETPHLLDEAADRVGGDPESLRRNRRSPRRDPESPATRSRISSRRRRIFVEETRSLLDEVANLLDEIRHLLDEIQHLLDETAHLLDETWHLLDETWHLLDETWHLLDDTAPLDDEP